MDTNITMFLWIILAYISGSIPFGKLVGLLHGKDIQRLGSGNIGFANVRRMLGWKPGIVVLLADITKGFVPIVFAKTVLHESQLDVVALAAIVGHVFPIWLRFKGGKGIATGLGVTLALDPFVALSGLGIYLLLVVVLKKSAPASVGGAWCLPIASSVFAPWHVYFYLILAVFGTWTHRNNLRIYLKSRDKRQ